MSRHFKTPSPTNRVLAGVTWVEHYNCYSVKLAGVMPLGFSYTSSGYKIQVNGDELEELAPDAQTAANRAIEQAGILSDKLAKRLAGLADATKEGKP